MWKTLLCLFLLLLYLLALEGTNPEGEATNPKHSGQFNLYMPTSNSFLRISSLAVAPLLLNFFLNSFQDTVKKAKCYSPFSPHDYLLYLHDFPPLCYHYHKMGLPGPCGVVNMQDINWNFNSTSSNFTLFLAPLCLVLKRMKNLTILLVSSPFSLLSQGFVDLHTPF